MKRFYLFVLAAMVGIVAQAYDFKIRIVDDLDSIPVERVRMDVMTMDSIPVGNTITDGFGYAEVKNLDGGEYLLKLTKEEMLPISAILNLTKDSDAGTLYMSYANVTALEGVVVNGSRVRQEIDKMVIIPKEVTLNSSLNTFDVLRRMNLAGMTVNPITRSITIYNSAAIIKVDGIPREADFLMNIKPEQIAKIEYTDNPTARYMQDGVGGIVNIILKEQYQGGSLYIYGSYSPTIWQAYGNIYATYNHKDSEFSLNISESGSHSLRPAENIQNTKYIGNTDGFVESRIGRYDIDVTNHSQNFNLSYKYNRKDNLTFNAGLSGSLSNGLNKNHGNLAINELNSEIIARRKNKDFSPTLDLFLMKTWGKRSLEVNLVGSINNSDIERYYDERNDFNPFFSYTKTDANQKGLVGEVRWKQPIKNVEWTIGLKETYSHSKNEYTGSRIDRLNDSRTYLNTSFGGYAGKFIYSIGGGVSYVYSDGLGFKDKSWNPGALFTVMYRPIDPLNISLDGEYAPSFPTLSQRTAIQEIVNSILLTGGNPEARTQHKWNIGLRANYSIDNFWVSAGARNAHINHPLFSEVAYLGDGKFLSYNTNFNHSNWFNTYISGKYSGIFNHLDLQLNLNYNNYKMSTTDYNKSFDCFGLGAYITAYWGNWYFYGEFVARSKTLWGYTLSSGNNHNFVAISYHIPHWQFNLSIENIGYAKKGRTSKNSIDSKHYTGLNITNEPYYGNAITLSVSYDLQFGRSYQGKGKTLYNQLKDESVIRVTQ